jgi:hypothetical protein
VDRVPAAVRSAQKPIGVEALIRWIPLGRAGIAGHVHPGGGAHGLIRPIT